MFAFVLIAVIALLLIACVRRVPEGQAKTIHRFGRYARTLTPGLNFVVPGLERIAHEVQLIGHHVELPARALGETAASADLYYQILDPAQTGGALDEVDALVLSQADAALAEVAAKDLPQASWAAAAEALKAEVNRRVGRLGLRVIRCALHPI